jgi:hypothetical protein
MSFEIHGVGSAQNAASLRAINGGAPSASATSGIEAPDDAVEVSTMPVAPPPEVMDAISTASQAYDQLASAGRRVSFGTDPTTGRLRLELQDLDGNTTGSLRPSHVLSIAGGATP